MKIRIKETGSIESLSIIDRKNGVDYIADFIGNNGGLCDGQFTWNDEADCYEADQETYDWWDRVVRAYDAADEAMEEFLESIDDEQDRQNARDRINDACNCDLEDIPGAIMAEIKEITEEMGPKDLKELFEMMQEDDEQLGKLYGDWSSLPTFGGEAPENTIQIWSWDEKNLIIGTCSKDIKIVSRDEYIP
jgi:hypothetical protein